VKDKTLLELVDGAYELVFVYKPSSPAQEAWKRNWLEKARRAGAGPDDMPIKDVPRRNDVGNSHLVWKKSEEA
jgi:hypothetical protein